MTKSIKLVGVGGQGTILAAKVLCQGLIEAGYDVKMSEIHGMSQRGGSVSSEVRYGKKVYSPVIEKGNADILVAFELMEAARYMDYIKPEGVVIINNHKINSMVTLNGKVPYPTGIYESISEKVKTTMFNASELAVELGNPKVANIILLGSLVKAMELTDIDFEKIIRESVKEKFVDINVKAFKLGLNQYQG
ncbi:indolepyruvate oxidoreductase subunit beta [Candidatus Izimaplasma bacterium ZiA1]|uniref:indolepyruvate oxidoreductase subunit beta n=1 Tax=Candidatus Izimoplasma sp. ZiA1 TaxID=2024899 RepID=UPI000BAA77F4|nr:indolepyruvate oxidoreductase subunit beta [Candidatus Izimaplasma bacterium ZiA1]